MNPDLETVNSLLLDLIRQALLDGAAMQKNPRADVSETMRDLNQRRLTILELVDSDSAAG
ncbi:hypothetical protein [Shimia aestuarii]|uniref:Uncharacterized protein n=1 Tax=Shimia aestuarii TaxID=254406 RepID=A0A1I4P2I0_9RHOB|nr:hypothetical protein [Shimia aestuarii]SFM21750.1 hypothetical protein SAMN04488042_10543 [Shimia aestuarii]